MWQALRQWGFLEFLSLEFVSNFVLRASDFWFIRVRIKRRESKRGHGGLTPGLLSSGCFHFLQYLLWPQEANDPEAVAFFTLGAHENQGGQS